ncbi:MAG: nucleic acid-binding protein [Tissierellia bacterium]|nr:nucleic acid-binding protein [Tissierellia bacterium]
MRKCIRCQTDMTENCSIKIGGAGFGIVMATNEKRLFVNRIGKLIVAICPSCSEVSINGRIS